MAQMCAWEEFIDRTVGVVGDSIVRVQSTEGARSAHESVELKNWKFGDLY